MGIQCLLKYLFRNDKIFHHQEVFEQYLPHDAILVVDAVGFHYEMKDKYLKDLRPQLNGNYSSFRQILKKELKVLMDDMGLKLIFVFDGYQGSRKLEEVVETSDDIEDDDQFDDVKVNVSTDRINDEKNTLSCSDTTPTSVKATAPAKDSHSQNDLSSPNLAKISDIRKKSYPSSIENRQEIMIADSPEVLSTSSEALLMLSGDPQDILHTLTIKKAEGNETSSLWQLSDKNETREYSGAYSTTSNSKSYGNDSGNNNRSDPDILFLREEQEGDDHDRLIIPKPCCPDNVSSNLPMSSSPASSHIKYLLNPGSLKLSTRESRLFKDILSWADFQSFCNMGMNFPKPYLPVPPLALKVLVEVLDELHIECLTSSNEEADSVIGHICKKGNMNAFEEDPDRIRPKYYCYSRDSDFIGMDKCPLILFDALSGNKYTGVVARRIWQRSILSRILGLKSEKAFVELCILIGNDYTNSFDCGEFFPNESIPSDISQKLDFFISFLKTKDSDFRLCSTNVKYEMAIYYSRLFYSLESDLSAVIFSVNDYMDRTQSTQISPILKSIDDKGVAKDKEIKKSGTYQQNRKFFWLSSIEKSFIDDFVAKSEDIGTDFVLRLLESYFVIIDKDTNDAASDDDVNDLGKTKETLSKCETFLHISQKHINAISEMLTKVNDPSYTPLERYDDISPQWNNVVAANAYQLIWKYILDVHAKKLRKQDNMAAFPVSRVFEGYEFHCFFRNSVEKDLILSQEESLEEHEYDDVQELDAEEEIFDNAVLMESDDLGNSIIDSTVHDLLLDIVNKAIISMPSLAGNLVGSIQVDREGSADIDNFEGSYSSDTTIERSQDVGDSMDDAGINRIISVDGEIVSNMEEHIFASHLPEVSKLPVDQNRDVILDRIHRSRISFIQAATGSGKSSRIPVFLHKLHPEKKILMTQPRRVAAKSIGARICDASGINVSIRMRGESNPAESNFPITIMTVGYFLKVLAGGLGQEHIPEAHRFDLSEYSYLIIDEIHERSVEYDILCLILRKILCRFPDLRVILMSASANFDIFKKYFESVCPIGDLLIISGKQYDIREVYIEDFLIENVEAGLMNGIVCSDRKHDRRIQNAKVVDLVNEMKKCWGSNFKIKQQLHNKQLDFAVDIIFEMGLSLERPYNAFLLFVDGFADILSIKDKLMNRRNSNSGKKIVIRAIHSELDIEFQLSAFAPVEENEIKVIIATNAAESSITLPDIDVVICLGYQKIKLLNKKTNTFELHRTWISQDSAEQRKGRTGRVRDGIVIRLYSRELYSQFHRHQQPAILRSQMNDAILLLHMLFESSSDFTGAESMFKDLIDSPDKIQVNWAYKDLFDWNFLHRNEDLSLCRLSQSGQFAIQLPVDSKYAKLIIHGILVGLGSEAIVVAGALMDQSPFHEGKLTLDNLKEFYDHNTSLLNGQQLFDFGYFSEPIMFINLYLRAKFGSIDYKFASRFGLSPHRLNMFIANIDQLFAAVNRVCTKKAIFHFNQIPALHPLHVHKLKMLFLWNNSNIFRAELTNPKRNLTSFTNSEEIELSDCTFPISRDTFSVVFPKESQYQYDEIKKVEILGSIKNGEILSSCDTINSRPFQNGGDIFDVIENFAKMYVPVGIDLIFCIVLDNSEKYWAERKSVFVNFYAFVFKHSKAEHEICSSLSNHNFAEVTSNDNYVCHLLDSIEAGKIDNCVKLYQMFDKYSSCIIRFERSKNCFQMDQTANFRNGQHNNLAIPAELARAIRSENIMSRVLMFPKSFSENGFSVDITNSDVRRVRMAQDARVMKLYKDPSSTTEVVNVLAEQKFFFWQALPLYVTIDFVAENKTSRYENKLLENEEIEREFQAIANDKGYDPFIVTNDGSTCRLKNKSLLSTCVNPRSIYSILSHSASNVTSHLEDIYAFSLSSDISAIGSRLICSTTMATFLPEGIDWIIFVLKMVDAKFSDSWYTTRYSKIIQPLDSDQIALKFNVALKNAMFSFEFIENDEVVGLFDQAVIFLNAQLCPSISSLPSFSLISDSVFNHNGILSNVPCFCCGKVFPTLSECMSHVRICSRRHDYRGDFLEAFRICKNAVCFLCGQHVPGRFPFSRHCVVSCRSDIVVSPRLYYHIYDAQWFYAYLHYCNKLFASKLGSMTVCDLLKLSAMERASGKIEYLENSKVVDDWAMVSPNRMLLSCSNYVTLCRLVYLFKKRHSRANQGEYESMITWKSSLYQCFFCNKEFSTTKRLSAHSCPPLRYPLGTKQKFLYCLVSCYRSPLKAEDIWSLKYICDGLNDYDSKFGEWYNPLYAELSVDIYPPSNENNQVQSTSYSQESDIPSSSATTFNTRFDNNNRVQNPNRGYRQEQFVGKRGAGAGAATDYSYKKESNRDQNKNKYKNKNSRDNSSTSTSVSNSGRITEAECLKYRNRSVHGDQATNKVDCMLPKRDIVPSLPDPPKLSAAERRKQKEDAIASDPSSRIYLTETEPSVNKERSQRSSTTKNIQQVNQDPEIRSSFKNNNGGRKESNFKAKQKAKLDEESYNNRSSGASFESAYHSRIVDMNNYASMESSETTPVEMSYQKEDRPVADVKAKTSDQITRSYPAPGKSKDEKKKQGIKKKQTDNKKNSPNNEDIDMLNDVDSLHELHRQVFEDSTEDNIFDVLNEIDERSTKPKHSGGKNGQHSSSEHHHNQGHAKANHVHPLLPPAPMLSKDSHREHTNHVQQSKNGVEFNDHSNVTKPRQGTSHSQASLSHQPNNSRHQHANHSSSQNEHQFNSSWSGFSQPYYFFPPAYYQSVSHFPEGYHNPQYYQFYSQQYPHHYPQHYPQHDYPQFQFQSQQGHHSLPPQHGDRPVVSHSEPNVEESSHPPRPSSSSLRTNVETDEDPEKVAVDALAKLRQQRPTRPVHHGAHSTAPSRNGNQQHASKPAHSSHGASRYSAAIAAAEAAAAETAAFASSHPTHTKNNQHHQANHSKQGDHSASRSKSFR